MALTQQQLEKLRKVRMFVLDMDGTIYLGESLFPFTKGFLRRVEETGRDFCFFTNNSSKTGRPIWKSFPAWASPSRRKKCSSPTG